MTAEAWLLARAGDAPERLVAIMLEAVSGAASSSIPDALAEGALTLYGRVVKGGGGREDAFPLLAADALFTHAFEAVAEVDPANVAEFAARWSSSAGLGRLAS